LAPHSCLQPTGREVYVADNICSVLRVGRTRPSAVTGMLGLKGVKLRYQFLYFYTKYFLVLAEDKYTRNSFTSTQVLWFFGYAFGTFTVGLSTTALVPGFLSPGLKRGQGMTLTTHPHLDPRSIMSRSYISSPPSAFVACSGTVLAVCHFIGKCLLACIAEST
jgi:hypothetical protein